MPTWWYRCHSAMPRSDRGLTLRSFLKEMSVTDLQSVSSLKVTISTIPNETTVVLLEQRGR